jgi:hypothetical protein
MVFSVRSETEATIGHLEISIIATKGGQARSKGKALLELFFDSSEIVHMEFIPGATVNKHRYKEILRCLRNSICCKHPEL